VFDIKQFVIHVLFKSVLTIHFITFLLKFLHLLILESEADPIDRAVLRRVSMTACLLGLRVRIPPGSLMSVSCECCVLSGRGLCVGLITRPEESYGVWCV